MNIPPATIQRAFDDVTGARDRAQNLLVVDRGPSWIRLMYNARAIDQFVPALGRAADALTTAAPGDATVAKAVDYLRGAAWHAARGVESLRTSTDAALAGHDELRRAASALLDPTSHVADYGTFENDVRHTDPALLARIETGAASSREAFERSRSDLDQAQTWLRELARRSQY